MKFSRRFVRSLQRLPELASAPAASRQWRELAWRYISGRGHYPFQLFLRSGSLLELHSREEVAVCWNILVRCCYHLPFQCATVLDVGANIGIFALWAVGQSPNIRVWAVEPCPVTYRRLTQHISANKLSHRIQSLPLAVAGQSGECQMVDFGPSVDRRLQLRVSETPCGPTVSVSSITLTELLELCRLRTVDLLKMDIEGSEWGALFSTPPEVLRRFHHINLEYHEVHTSFGYTPEKLISHLASAGHELIFRKEDELRTGLAYFRLRP
jgi:FkbM family methyltransferase